MANNRISQLLKASFRGVPFSVRSEAVAEAGRKLVLHEYVNSDERFVEDQGKRPPSVTIRGFVHGADFRSRAELLERALNERGHGVLSSPTFGVFEAYAGAYSKDASQQSVGEISYIIPFYAGRPVPGPTEGHSTIHEVHQASDEALQAIEHDFSDLCQPPRNAIGSRVAIGDLNNIINSILRGASTFIPPEFIGMAEEILKEVRADSARVVRDPARLARLLFSGTRGKSGLWRVISLGLSSAGATGSAVEQLKLFANVGGGLSLVLADVHRAVPIPIDDDTIALWPATTAQRIDRNTRRVVMAQANRTAALTCFYEAAATRTYVTDIEIAESRAEIETLYERIMRSDVGDKHDFIQSKTAVRNAVEDVRNAALDVIGQREQEALKLGEDELRAPAPVLVYSYARYAETMPGTDQLGERAGQLANLNRAQSSIAIADRIKMFRAP